MELSRQMLLLAAENYGSYYLHITYFLFRYKVTKYNYKYGIMPNIYLIIFLFSKDSINISNNKISINKDNKNIFIHFQLYLYPLMFYRMGRYCLPDSCFLLVCDPETSSRVTLTLLGTGFQPDLLFGCLVV